MDSKGKLRPIIKMMLQWPLYMIALLCFMDIYVFTIDIKSGIVAAVFVGIYVITIVAVYLVQRKTLNQELVRFGVNFGTVQRKLQTEMLLPYTVIDSTGRILWFNKQFLELAGNRIKSRQPITDLLPELKTDVMPQGDETTEVRFALGERSFRAEMKKIGVESFVEDTYWNSEKRLPGNDAEDALISVYLYDETLITRLQKDLYDQEMIIGLLYIDNYDEALESIDEVRRSLLTALVDRKINKYFQNYDTVIKKIEKDKYILIFQNQYLDQLKSAKFPILDEVRAVNIGNEMSVTISIGIGAKADTYNRAYEAARAAIDLALGRGGDQAIIKSSDTVEYFGGKTGSVEKNTKVKARTKAHALRELIEVKDKVLVMGHSMPDVDSFGSAVGIYRIASSLNKEAHIVMSEATSALDVMVSRFRDNPDYTNMLITPDQALSMVDALTLVVLVDVNRPSFTECPELVERSKATVVLDHHRQSGEAVENAALSYIETAASSACEVVAEIFQYIGDGFRLRPLEADAMFAGLMIDSNNFQSKTGIRTFEAAAFLRRSGADITRIRKAFRTDLTEYLVKAKSVAQTEIFLDSYAFTTCEAEGADSPTILGAQVANELMDVSDIKASFVFTKFNDQIYVSARSIDEVNVQVVMEKLGGGGHMSAAGVQFDDCDIDEAKTRVKNVIENMVKGGEI